MDSFKPAFVFLCASLALHTTVVLSLGKPWLGSAHESSEPIPIAYLQNEKPVLQAPVRQEPVKPEIVKRKIRGIPVPRLSPEEVAAQKASEEAFRKTMQENLQKQQTQLARLAAAERTEPEKTRPKTSAEILADPQKGKVFVGYFSEVKRKIQKTLLERYAHRYSGQGHVTLTFVLNARGVLEKVVVATKSAEADEMLQDMAVQCLHTAAPFGAFPPDLGSQRIAFNVTIFFDGT